MHIWLIQNTCNIILRSMRTWLQFSNSKISLRYQFQCLIINGRRISLLIYCLIQYSVSLFVLLYPSRTTDVPFASSLHERIQKSLVGFEPKAATGKRFEINDNRATRPRRGENTRTCINNFFLLQ